MKSGDFMPVETSLWRIQDSTLAEARRDALESEALLHKWIKENPSLISTDLLIIGSDVPTPYGGYIDLLGVDSAGSIHVIELKKGKTPTEVVAQGLDYASCVVKFGFDDFDAICQSYMNRDLRTACQDRFHDALPETLNEKHSITIVASSLDAASERIVQYLSDYHGLNINAAFFTVFEDSFGKALTRSWLIDPEEASARSEERTERVQRADWTGYYFVNISVEKRVDRANWADNQKYSFVSAYGGVRYRRSMQKLQPGDKIFAYAKGRGYVGYGIAARAAMMARDFRLPNGELLLDQKLEGSSYLRENLNDEDLAAYVVAVDWIVMVSLEDAKRQQGIYPNQQVVCKIYDSTTVEFLWHAFGLASSDHVQAALSDSVKP